MKKILMIHVLLFLLFLTSCGKSRVIDETIPKTTDSETVKTQEVTNKTHSQEDYNSFIDKALFLAGYNLNGVYSDLGKLKSIFILPLSFLSSNVRYVDDTDSMKEIIRLIDENEISFIEYTGEITGFNMEFYFSFDDLTLFFQVDNETKDFYLVLEQKKYVSTNPVKNSTEIDIFAYEHRALHSKS